MHDSLGFGQKGKRLGSGRGVRTAGAVAQNVRCAGKMAYTVLFCLCLRDVSWSAAAAG